MIYIYINEFAYIFINYAAQTAFMNRFLNKTLNENIEKAQSDSVSITVTILDKDSTYIMYYV